ncbi:MobF family relaxase [Sporichthya polymorpha]|uniref:MobF family relaxase n=1 Tax=Sporichthya polymorpha TaxID=35751 RepID=UPI00036D4918|nr:MobF family relaxase [Sporichthya polymorpha]
MAYVTRIGPSVAQVEYRLVAGAGCGTQMRPDFDGPSATDPPAGADAAPPSAVDQGTSSDPQIDYRADGERPLRWVGAGCADYGVIEGAPFRAGDLAKARQLMDGVDWRTGERLVAAKVEAAPSAKVPGAPLLQAIRAEANRRDLDPDELLSTDRHRQLLRRLERGVRARGELYALHVDLAAPLAEAAGLDPPAIWGQTFTDALRHRNDRIDVRNRGYDIALTLPKSFSVLLAFAPPALAADLERQVFDGAVHDTLRYAESVAAYGMRGHHGDGRSAERIDGSGFVGWSLIHRTSRAGDPHHHVHLCIANMTNGTDGQWSAIAAGGRDLMRHTHAIGAYFEARTRDLLHTRFGITCSRNLDSGQWEIDGIPPATIRLFSKRDDQIRSFLHRLGLTWDGASLGVRRTARDATRDVKDPDAAVSDADLRARWHAEARAYGDDPARIVAIVRRLRGRPPHPLDLNAIAARVFDPATGLTANRKIFDRAAAFARILELLPDGVPDLPTADRIVDAILDRSPQAIALPPAGPQHMSDVARYTTADLVTAEQTVLSSARDRIGVGAAAVPGPVATAALGAYEARTGRTLSDEQRAAYHRLVGGGHGIDALIGVAGSGKTAIIAAAREAWHAAGYTVTGTATAAVAAQHLRAEAGIPTTTIAALLHGAHVLGDVLIVDEAAMVDERAMAALVAAAGQQGTKIVAIGDPKQLRAAGPGGSFAHVHHIIDGLTLTTNRRQRDPADRAAVALARDGRYADALRDWAARGHVHATATREDALVAMVTAFLDHRAGYPDPQQRLRQVLMIAYTNADVTALNHGARALLQQAGEVSTAERTYHLAGGDTLALAVGDTVRVRTNLWSRTDPDKALLNGHRGLISALHRNGSITVTWTLGDEPVRNTVVTAAEIARGALSHGYAITDHAAQGQTADVALVYPAGMDANAAYPALTRHRNELHLFIGLDQVEDEIAQLRLGPAPQSDPAAVRKRAVEGLAAAITTTPEPMVSLELVRATSPRDLISTPRPAPAVDQPAGIAAERLRAAVAAAAEFYAAQPHPVWVPAYLAGRGLTLADLPGAGYAPPEPTALRDHLRSRGFGDEELIAAGLLTPSRDGTLIDRLRGRLILPIRDEIDPVAFLGRAHPSATLAPKWLNTPQTDLYSKGHLLYGLGEQADALRGGAIPVLAEGALDAAAITRAGAGRYVGLAPLGTAVTDRHLHALAQLVGVVRDIIVAFDADPAGQSAAARAYPRARELSPLPRALRLPDGADPASYLAAAGPDALLRRLDASRPLIDDVIEHRLAARGDQLRWVEGRVAALRDVAPLVAELPTEEVGVRIAALADRLDLDRRTVLDEVVAAAPRQAPTDPPSGRNDGSPRDGAPGAASIPRRRRDVEAAARRASPRRERRAAPDRGHDRTIGR